METKLRFLISRKMGRTVRLKLIIGISLILPLLLVGSMTSVVFAALGDETTAGTFTLTPTYECISVYASFSGDNNANNSALLEYRPQGSGSWVRGMDMTPDRRGYAPSQYRNQWRASILGLQPNTEYEVRVTFSDPDGVSGTNPVTGTVRTRNDNPPSNGNTYYVATDGNDSTGDGTEGNPWRTIQHAADSVSAGDTVLVKAGTYVEGQEIIVDRNGAPDNYITIRNFASDNVVIDARNNPLGLGQGWNSGGLWVIGSYIRIRGFEVWGGDIGIYVGPVSIPDIAPVQPHDVIIEDCIVRDSKTLSSTPRGYFGIAIGGQSNSFVTDVENITLQGNDIYVVEPGGTPGYTSGPGITMYNANGGHVIRNNRIFFTGTVDLDVHGRDGINNQPNFDETYTLRDMDIYNNYIQGATDDGISLDGNSANVRLWDNVITRANIGISVSPVIIGPAYIFRNVWYDPELHWLGSNGWVKGGEDSTGYVYFYHNTVVYDDLTVGTTASGGSGKDARANYGFTQWGDETDSINVFLLNNIIETDGPVVSGELDEPRMDFDLLYNHFTYTHRDYWAKWDGSEFGSQGSTNAENLADFQSGTGQEANGVAGQAIFVDRANADFHLAGGSPGINQGAVIYGFNDPNSPWPYSGLAPDIGAYEYDSGPATPVPPVLDPIGDKLVNEGQLLQFTISATDLNNDLLTCLASNLPIGASFTDNGDGTGSFSWTPAYDQAGSPNVQFQVSDGSLTDSENIIITVIDANGPPVLDPIGNKSVNEEQLLQFTISANDPNDDPLIYSANNTPPGASFDSGSQTFSWTPSSGQAGSYPNVQFQVSDGALTDSENIIITVVPPSPPVLDTIGNMSVNEGWLLKFTISATDPNSDPLTYSANLTSLPPEASFDPANQTFSWTPSSGQAGSYYTDVHFEVTDGQFNDSENITITVNGPLPLPLRVNAGVDNYTDSSGNFWQADKAYASGNWGFYGGDNTVDRGTGHAISGTNDDRIYQTERYGLSGYRFDLGNDTYEVTLHFAETYGGIGPGQRVFDVSIEGQLVLDDLDIFSEAGYSTALTKVFSDIAVQDGQLDIAFTGSIENPVINGIEIAAAASNDTPAPPAGGGGGLLPITYRNSQGILVDGTINTFGEVRGTIKAYSTDGKVMATILVGKYAKDEKGRPLSELTMTVDESPSPAQEGTTIIGTAHNFQPDGATFEPAITVVWSYDPQTIPAGVSEGELFAAYWDGNKWVALESTVNIEDNTVSAAVAHFTPFAIFGTLPPAPAGFTTSDLSVSPGEVLIRESVTVSVLVTNTGELRGTHDVTLKIDDVVIKTKELTLDGGASQELTFTVSADATGTYAIDVDGLSGTFEVRRTATFVCSDLSISPAQVDIGEEAAISILVTNTGDVSRTHEVILKIDNAVEATKEVTLDGGASQKVTFTTTRDAAGFFIVNVNGITGSLQVKEAISDFSVTPIYDGDTGFPFGADSSVRGDKLALARIDYQANGLYQSMTDVELVLKVFLDGEPLEEVSLLSSSQHQPDGNSNSLDYIPSQGWMIGTYTFEAELYKGGKLVQRTKPEQLQVTPESVVAVNWGTLGRIIGATLIVIVAVVVVVLYQRRNMLRGHIEDK